MDELDEYAEAAREARADAAARSSGCGCFGWGIGAIILLVLVDGVIHIWFPLLFLVILLIMAGMGITLVVSAIRGRGASRGTFDPRNADWHPLAVVRNARRESIARAALRRTPPPAALPTDPVTADPAIAAAAAGAEIGDPPVPPEPAPDDGGPAATDAAYSPEAPVAPDAPEPPDWA